MKTWAFGAAILVLATAVGARAYEAVDVKDGGTIAGRVKVAGPLPKDDVIKVTKDQSHCGETLPREKYVFGKDRGVLNAVVMITDIAKGKRIPPADVPIVNKMCAFHPHVQTAVKGQSMVVVNQDPMLHNTHMYLDKKTVFNAALPRTGMEIKKPIQKAGLVSIQCDEHDWMQGYLYVADQPYLSTTDDTGAYSLGDVPPGTYKVKVWHEAFGEQVQTVTVPAKGKVVADFELK
jgi:plastocyanin